MLHYLKHIIHIYICIHYTAVKDLLTQLGKKRGIKIIKISKIPNWCKPFGRLQNRTEVSVTLSERMVHGQHPVVPIV